jgi:hypothetical protein
MPREERAVAPRECAPMNELTPWQRERILERLREGRSLRAIESETGHRRETIARYGRRAGLLPPVTRRTSARPERAESQRCRSGARSVRGMPHLRGRNRDRTSVVRCRSR